MSAFLGVASIDQPASAYVARHGRVEREFSHLTQDSGNELRRSFPPGAVTAPA